MDKPEKLIPETNVKNKSLIQRVYGYNEAYDELTAYYESPEYIQKLIDEGKVVVDAGKVNYVLWEADNKLELSFRKDIADILVRDSKEFLKVVVDE